MSKAQTPTLADRADRFITPDGAGEIELPAGRGPLPWGPRQARRRAQASKLAGLAQVRKSVGLTQAELGERLGMTQSKVSQLERQDDARLSSIVNYLTAMGGHDIEIRAVVPASGGQAESEVVVPLRQQGA